MARIMRIALGVVGWALTIIGVASLPQDLKIWKGWLKPFAQIDQGIARWLLVGVGLILALTAHLGPRIRAWRRSRRRALRVVIDREQWTNFRHLGMILEIHVRVSNRTDTRKQLTRFQLQTHSGGQATNEDEHLEVSREAEHRKEQRNTLDRISVLEPGETVAGWMVYALPRNTAPGEPEYAFSVIDELNNKYEAKAPARVGTSSG
jgi:hypothetical protein